jgi:O-antigen/teichoic acid export membrane protein
MTAQESTGAPMTAQESAGAPMTAPESADPPVAARAQRSVAGSGWLAPVRRLLGLLPTGTVPVGSGLVVLGVASYVHLAVAGHALDEAASASLSVLWAIVFSVGIGLFMPIEQEITRLVAARRGSGDGPAPVYLRGAVLALGLLAATAVILVVGAGPIAHRLFDGDRAQLWVLLGAFGGLALAHPTRGLLAGTGRFGSYGAQLGIDGGLRIVLALAFGAAGVHSAVGYALILTIAPVISVLCTAPAVIRLLHHGASVAWSTLARGVAPLAVSTLLAQLVVNVGVINVKLLDPDDKPLAKAMLSALILARVPVFVFASLQAALLPGLSTLVVSGQRAEFRRLLIRACALVLVPCGLIGLPAIFAGPWAIGTFFNAEPVLGDWDFAVLVLGTTGYLLALVLGQGVLALGRHRQQTLAWLVGTAVLVAVTLLPGDLSLRVGAGYAVGSVAVAGLLLLFLTLGRHGAPPRSTVAADAALVTAGGGG